MSPVQYKHLQAAQPSCGVGYTNVTHTYMQTHLENCVLLWRQIIHKVL